MLLTKYFSLYKYTYMNKRPSSEQWLSLISIHYLLLANLNSSSLNLIYPKKKEKKKKKKIKFCLWDLLLSTYKERKKERKIKACCLRLCEFLIWEKWQVLRGRSEQMGRRVHHLHGLSWRIWRRKIWWWAESRSFALLLIHLHRLLLWILTRLSGFSLVPLNLRSRKPLGSLLCRFLSPFFIELNFFFFQVLFVGFCSKFVFLFFVFAVSSGCMQRKQLWSSVSSD